ENAMSNDRRDLVAQMKNRALIYKETYDVLAEELGAAKAEALLTKAIYRRGRAMGAAFSKFAPADLGGLCEAFLGSVPGGKDIFQPEVLKKEPAELEIQLHGCPLKDAWREAGLAEDKVATLCRIAGAVDKGLFEGAGFKIENRTWTPGAKGCCFLRILRG
ncbi:MAG: L-2-amino-thiazoline-4-carboxylic acid hydrolase, partial [Betaproteobacteria bacterium]|nr:L-2-amino-thiazoline-4-carboxylic acid hydrolase [Betaproteobacteria bacterium]